MTVGPSTDPPRLEVPLTLHFSYPSSCSNSVYFGLPHLEVECDSRGATHPQAERPSTRLLVDHGRSPPAPKPTEVVSDDFESLSSNRDFTRSGNEYPVTIVMINMHHHTRSHRASESIDWTQRTRLDEFLRLDDDLCPTIVENEKPRFLRLARRKVRGTLHSRGDAC